MKWSEQSWKNIQPVFDKIIQMPFITELMAGTLPKEKFQFYIMQDSCYLEHFGRALAFTGAKATDIEHALAFIRFAEGAIVVENALHTSYFQDYGVSDRGIIQPACHHYIHFLKSTVAYEPVEVGMAALLPCFWIYKAVGDYVFAKASADNPYQKWINTYAGEAFGISVQKAIQICDAVASQATAFTRTRMTEAFTTATILEYDFWDAAYTLRAWA